MRVTPCLLISAALIFSIPAVAAETLPIKAGRWSGNGCVRPHPDDTRYFTGRSTSTHYESCAVTIKSVSGTVYNLHLACRYTQARNDEDDVVLQVNSPVSVTWINQCVAKPYHFCGP